MQVVGQQRGPRGRPLRLGAEGIAAKRLFGAQEAKRVVIRLRVQAPFGRTKAGTGKQPRIVGQGGRYAGPVDDLHAAFGPGQGQPGAQDFLSRGIGAGRRHQLQDRQRIGGLPEGDDIREQEEFGRAAPHRTVVDDADPLVHPVGIGLQRRKRVIVLHLQRSLGRALQAQPADQVVGGQGARAMDLGQPALRRAAQQGHLEQPVLRMGQAQGKEHVRVGLAEDVRHILGRAHDLDRGGDARHRIAGGIVGQGPHGEIPDQHGGQDRQDDQRDGQPQKPAKQGQHVRAGPWPGARHGLTLPRMDGGVLHRTGARAFQRTPAPRAATRGRFAWPRRRFWDWA